MWLYLLLIVILVIIIFCWILLPFSSSSQLYSTIMIVGPEQEIVSEVKNYGFMSLEMTGQAQENGTIFIIANQSDFTIKEKTLVFDLAHNQGAKPNVIQLGAKTENLATLVGELGQTLAIISDGSELTPLFTGQNYTFENFNFPDVEVYLCLTDQLDLILPIVTQANSQIKIVTLLPIEPLDFSRTVYSIQPYFQGNNYTLALEMIGNRNKDQIISYYQASGLIDADLCRIEGAYGLMVWDQSWQWFEVIGQKTANKGAYFQKF